METHAHSNQDVSQLGDEIVHGDDMVTVSRAADVAPVHHLKDVCSNQHGEMDSNVCTDYITLCNHFNINQSVLFLLVLFFMLEIRSGENYY